MLHFNNLVYELEINSFLSMCMCIYVCNACRCVLKGYNVISFVLHKPYAYLFVPKVIQYLLTFMHPYYMCIVMYALRTYVVTYVCTYVCIYVCMYACMYVRTYVHTYVRTYVRMYVCMYVCMYVHVCISVGQYYDITVNRQY